MPVLLDKPLGKFRNVLRTESTLKQESKYLKPYLEFLKSSYQSKSLDHIETIFLFVILYQCNRVKDRPFQRNPIHSKLLIATNKQFPVEFDFIYSLKLETSNIIEFLKMYSFRFLPTSIRDVLLNVFHDKNKLFLRTDIPTSMEMLSMQAEGKRYITIDFDSALNGKLVDNKRDAYEFVLHDLEHAHCFFKKENEYEKQISFYQCIQKNYHLLYPLIEDSKEFKKDLEYCISDMNSHPGHLINYLKAILIKYFLFKNLKPSNGILTPTELIPLNEIMEKFEIAIDFDKNRPY